jgi:LacI family transcriptional regulator
MYPQVRGIYHASTGSVPVVQALRQLDRADTTVFITHELTDNRRALLRERAIDAVIDQNPAFEARVAVETMARLLGRLEGEPVTTVTDIRIYMAENA